MSRDRLRATHAGDKAAGLSERQIADLHAHFVACEPRPRLPFTARDPLLALCAPRPGICSARWRQCSPIHFVPFLSALPLPPCPASHADMQQLARSAVVDGEPLLRQRVVGTAAIYWHKFYFAADFSSPGGDPRHMAPACLLLASKAGKGSRGMHGSPGWACPVIARTQHRRNQGRGPFHPLAILRLS